MKEEAPLGNPFIGEPRGGRPASQVWWSSGCSHGNLMAHVEQDKTLSRKVSLDAFLFKTTKGNESN
jgi:hypothetical protein